MINVRHLPKVTAVWITIIWIFCFGGVALVPGITPWFMRYALHMNVGAVENVMTVTTFISGLLIWNVIALLCAWLFAFLFNKFRE